MEKATNSIASFINTESKIYNISPQKMYLIFLSPFILVFGFCLVWFIPLTHEFGLWLTKENHPIELFTFIFLFLGSMWGIYSSWAMKASEKVPFIAWFTVFLFSLGLFAIAMEEISWGQQIVEFISADSLNEQEEITVYNIKGLEGNLEFFQLFFGIAGLIGIWANLFFLNSIRPAKVLTACFFIIITIAILDLCNNYTTLGVSFAYFIRRLLEVNEMLIGMSGFLYVFLLARKVKNASYNDERAELLNKAPREFVIGN